jgi:hypothetical protein
MADRPPMGDGFDSVGPFHPYLVIGAMLLLDIAIILMVLGAFTFVGDKLEDAIWPGGEEWVDL